MGRAGARGSGRESDLLRRINAPSELALHVAQAVISMAVAIERKGTPQPIQHGSALPRVPNEGEHRYKTLQNAYKDIEGNFENVKQHVANMDREGMGPDLTAINAAATELFIEKQPLLSSVGDIAKAAAPKRIASLRKPADTRHSEMTSARVDLATANAKVAKLKTELAQQQRHTPTTGNVSLAWMSSMFAFTRSNPVAEKMADHVRAALAFRLEAATVSLQVAQAHYDTRRAQALT